MIKYIEVENFKGIWNKRRISFVGNKKRTKTKANSLRINDENILLVSALFGKNASGKSSFLESLNLYRSLLSNSNFNSAKDHLQRQRTRDDKINIENNNESYHVIPNNEIYDLFKRYNFNNPQKKLKVTICFIDEKTTVKHSIKITSDMKIGEKITINGKVMVNYGVNEFSEWKDSKIKNFPFKRTQLNYWLSEFQVSHIIEFEKSKNFKNNNMAFIEWMKIADEKIEKIEFDDDGTIGNFVHLKLPNGDKRKISRYKLSTGTKKWMNLYGTIFHSLVETQTILVLDEMDRSIHSSMANYIISLFSNNNINKMNSQLIFSSHNPSIVRESFPKDSLNLIIRDEHVNLGKDNQLKQDINFAKNYFNERIGEHPSASKKMDFLESIIEINKK